MVKWRGRLALVSSASAWLLLAGAVPALADSGHGLTISPVYSELNLKKNQTDLRRVITVGNESNVPQEFTLSVVDFGSLDEEGGVAFLGQPISELDHTFGLASWMKLDRTSVTVPAGQTIDVAATIDNRQSLSAGGHYGAILATAITDTAAKVADPQVGVKQVLSSLILLTKDGGTRKNIAIVSQKLDGAWWHLPNKIEQRFSNTGNVHVVPRGVVTVTDPAGRVVRRGALNDASGAVLPSSFRRYYTQLDALATAWLPGLYTVQTVYRPDGVDTTKTSTTSIWFAGALILWVVLLAVILATCGLAWWLLGRPKKQS